MGVVLIGFFASYYGDFARIQVQIHVVSLYSTPSPSNQIAPAPQTITELATYTI